VSGKDAEQLIKLMDHLEDNEDVSKVHADFEISDEEMSRIAIT
jgi:transcriptional/translational regulatory protein YebC/TACO1